LKKCVKSIKKETNLRGYPKMKKLTIKGCDRRGKKNHFKTEKGKGPGQRGKKKFRWGVVNLPCTDSLRNSSARKKKKIGTGRGSRGGGNFSKEGPRE